MSDDPNDLKTNLEHTKDRFFDAAGSSKDALSNWQDAANANRAFPLLLIGAAAGIAVGILAPLTAFEKSRLYPIGDELVRRGVDARNEVLAQGRAVVEETVAAARTSFEQHGHEAAVHLGVAESHEGGTESDTDHQHAGQT